MDKIQKISQEIISAIDYEKKARTSLSMIEIGLKEGLKEVSKIKRIIGKGKDAKNQYMKIRNMLKENINIDSDLNELNSYFRSGSF